MKKFVSEEDIQMAFEYLLEMNGKTTSLDVKENLREQNFYVTQEMVSDCIKENYTEWYDGNVYRDYENNHYVYYSNSVEEDDDQINNEEENDVDTFIMVVRSFGFNI